MLSFLEKIYFNKYRDLFVVRLGVTLLLGKIGIVGAWANFLMRPICGFIGLLMETGVFQIDLLLDAYREGQKLDEFKKEAKRLYDKTVAKVYDEAKKQEIRKQYLEVIRKIGPVGNGPK